MKQIACILAITLMVFAGLSARAADPAPQDKKSAQTSGSAGCNKQWAQIQGNMAKMYGLMTQIQNTTDPAERQKLLNEHWQLMQQNMQAMRGFGGPMMRGGMGPGAGMGPGMMGGAGPGYGMGPGMMGASPCQGSPAGMTEQQREKFMQRRLDTMQMMMEQMLMRQQYAPAVPGK